MKAFPRYNHELAQRTHRQMKDRLKCEIFRDKTKVRINIRLSFFYLNSVILK